MCLDYSVRQRGSRESIPYMFRQLKPATTCSERGFKLASLALHAVVLAWLLHAPEPRLLNPNSVAYGQNGTSVTRLYWSSKTPDAGSHSSPDVVTQRYRHERLGQKLTWKASKEVAKLSAPQTPVSKAEAEDNAKTQTLSAQGHGAQAGATYGTLAQGSFYGEEIRPALPIATADPSVWPWQLPEAPGNEVIEITIDERGEITNKVVLHSLGADIDSKCLAALENWHFHPATRNGSPIPSKQDAIFPFRARG
jgi:TonB family protein